jgi:peptidoglycan/xylan/chitin deacetylase (PgdA/CDA1 family)
VSQRRVLNSAARAVAMAGMLLAVAALAACSTHTPAPSRAVSSSATWAAAQSHKAGTEPTSASSRPASTSTPAADTTGVASAQSTSTAWEARYRGILVRGFRPERGYQAVALTFDDGPNHQTGYIIKTLQRFGGHATFFDTGKNLLKGDYARQAIAISQAGFELGDHTQDHMPNLVSCIWHNSYAHDVYEITNPDKIIARYVPFKTLWLRPPGGSIDLTGVKAAEATGHLVINYTIDSNDSHGGVRTPDYIYGMCTRNVRSGDVILLHVTSLPSMAALPRICAILTSEGFQLVTVSELAEHSTPIAETIPR